MPSPVITARAAASGQRRHESRDMGLIVRAGVEDRVANQFAGVVAVTRMCMSSTKEGDADSAVCGGGAPGVAAITGPVEIRNRSHDAASQCLQQKESCAVRASVRKQRTVMRHHLGMAFVFFSYAHADKTLAHKLANLLQEEGVDVWIDFWELKIGDSIIQRIADALDSVDYVVALVSKNSVDSNWCRKELAIAVTQELNGPVVRVLPLRVGDVRMPATLIDKLYLEVDEANLADCARRLLGRIIRRRKSKPQIRAVREHAIHQGSVFNSRLLNNQGHLSWLTAGEDGALWSRDIKEPSLDHLLVQLPEPIRCISVVKGSERPLLACGSTHGSVFLVNYADGSVIAKHHITRRYIWCIEAFMQNGQPRAAYSAADEVVRFRDLVSGDPFLPDYNVVGDVIGPIVMATDLSRPALLFAGLAEGGRRRHGIAYAVDPRSGEIWSSIYPADYGPVWAVDAYRHDGTDICVTAGFSAVIHSWDLEYKDKISETDSYGILGITALKILKLHGEPIALSGGGQEDGKLRLTRLIDGALVDSHQAHSHRVQSLDVARTTSGYYAVTASDDGSAGVYLVS
jgi:TIR domain